jgi:hypothetical protein
VETRLREFFGLLLWTRKTGPHSFTLYRMVFEWITADEAAKLSAKAKAIQNVCRNKMPETTSPLFSLARARARD